ncbi:hypothetical protein M427DRAFT_37503 [Gonapodya prolifera JEL478]|uniref:Piwi domain-containing protein n=1 Tax=Gonapodya prolifera (strain JEL478) TaxID=1344416 RepID=A0A139A0P3_GONPJ|nr:hypothetical protein M427DRAFT_37503 [Gonapodya prolifera JEL478]|eukprot:KXS10339.1 hypothetical protein M427DRAFT_37503 [Gonapodya prolifera JEL478]
MTLGLSTGATIAQSRTPAPLSMADFGLGIVNEPKEVARRELDLPSNVFFGGGGSESVTLKNIPNRSADVTWKTGSQRAFVPGKLTLWALINASPNTYPNNKRDGTVRSLMDAMVSFRMQPEHPSCVMTTRSGVQWKRILRKLSLRLAGRMDGLILTSPSVEAIAHSTDRIFSLLLWAKKQDETPFITSPYLLERFVRKGVSEAELPILLFDEVPGSDRAAETVQPGYRPQITHLSANKQQSVRFFAIKKDSNGSFVGGDGNGNLLPGLVTDRDVTNPAL